MDEIDEQKKAKLRKEIKAQKGFFKGTWPDGGGDLKSGDTEGFELMHVQQDHLTLLEMQLADMHKSELFKYALENYAICDEWDVYHCFFCDGVAQPYEKAETIKHEDGCIYKQIIEDELQDYA